MKVKTSSWHYRLWRFGRESSKSRPRDLCRYFWHLLLIKLLLPAILAGLVLFGLWTLAWAIWHNPVQFAIGLFVVDLVVGVGVGAALFARRQIAKKKEEEKTWEPGPVKEPSLFRQYLAARKRKVCPLIEVVEKEAG